MNKQFFIVAGDPSGDAHAALLMKQLRIEYPECVFVGIGGPAMQEAGLQSIVEFSSMNIVGFLEVLQHYPHLRRTLQHCKKEIATKKYDAFIAVDYPGFNIRLGQFAKKIGIPSIYYIAPQLWAWGEHRAHSLQKAADIVLTVFPFEQEFFAKHSIQTAFVGHPLLDQAIFQTAPLSRVNGPICLMPGSRPQEISRHIGLIKEIIPLLLDQAEHPILCVPKELAHHSLIKQIHNIDISTNAREVMAEAKGGVVKVGTSTLEAALLGMPFIAFYKTSYISYRIALSSITLPWISLPNILLEQAIIPEYIQQDAESKAIHSALRRVLPNGDQHQDQLDAFNEIRSLLGGPGASERAAKTIAHFLSGHS